MSIEARIHAALEAHLRAFAEPREIRVARQGFAFDPPMADGQDANGNPIKVPVTYLRTSFLPNRTERLFINNPEHRRPGIFQVSVMAPPGQGLFPFLAIASDVAAHFAMDGRLTSGGTTTRITAAPSIAPPIVEAASIQIPVSIPFEALA